MSDDERDATRRVRRPSSGRLQWIEMNPSTVVATSPLQQQYMVQVCFDSLGLLSVLDAFERRVVRRRGRIAPPADLLVD